MSTLAPIFSDLSRGIGELVSRTPSQATSTSARLAWSRRCRSRGPPPAGRCPRRYAARTIKSKEMDSEIE